ncbi:MULTISPECIES: hypothetical protein [Mycobacteroides]|jgi:hypothetical protein|uniref:Uncharacterized protein n=2 Tax=Mycobacteroides TaxID=670516 RepID=A0ABR5LTC8_9MYCO|nr:MULTISPECIES: hypothetical protein [Mycobacteroides]KPG34333.1 hypothetical protein AN912_11400 [Mycobacteroides immunogenum]ORB55279.1 hypothetical protein BST43_15540 [Mycobacteroides saopaulense]SKN58005.1 Uncharacterised protein [Mycobacteroides abscessus subsp. massiliense]SKR65729.1 Uncharacterised protein [Mycobacteroides abscessus subsp. abscessus]SLH52931.1 Uncharacterised protein [Mycobacteroides abscessus subsp. massiliense]
MSDTEPLEYFDSWVNGAEDALNAGNLKLALAQIVAAMRSMSTAVAAAKTEVVDIPRRDPVRRMVTRIIDTLRDIRVATNQPVHGFIYVCPEDAKTLHVLFNGESVPPYNPKSGDKATLFGEMALVDDDLTPGAIYIGVKVQGV